MSLGLAAVFLTAIGAHPLAAQSATSSGSTVFSGETAVTAFVGVIPDDAATSGGSRLASANRPVSVDSWSEFTFRFGDFQPPSRRSSQDDAVAARMLRHSVHGFFANGGTRAWILRVSTTAELADPRRALQALNSVDIDLVAVPGAISSRQQDAILDHVEAAGDRFALLDGQPEPRRPTVTEVRGTRRNSDRAMLLFPWIVVNDSLAKGTVSQPPSGHVAGVIARNDRQKGVHSAPANLPLSDAVAPEHSLSQNSVSGLATNGVLVLLDGSGAGGARTWGARTLGGDANGQFRYINVRRTVDQVSKHIVAKSPPSCRSALAEAELLLQEMWRAGALQGTKQQDAWFARCDSKSLRLGLALLRPTEFTLLSMSFPS
jgi:phage tail sheath protein FI